MLKRLFISLLILTALSSEGVAYLPLNVYNLYFNNEDTQNYTSCSSITEGVVRNAGISRGPGSNVFFNGFTPVKYSVNKSKTPTLFENYNFNTHVSINLQDKSTSAYQFSVDKNILFFVTDNSPPHIT